VAINDACTATDAIALSQSPAAGTLVGIGTHTITVTATDVAGNIASCTTSFTVSDNTAPMIDRTMWLDERTFLIEFAATPNQVYHIQYSEDSLTWKTVTPGVSNSATRIQWVDDGPPKTESLPSDRLTRFYRVVTLP